MAKSKPIYGTVPYYPDRCVINYGIEGSEYSRIATTGTFDIFKNAPLPMPVIRFDLSPEDAVFGLPTTEPLCLECEEPSMFDRPERALHAADYLEWFKSRGIVVETVGTLSPLKLN